MLNPVLKTRGGPKESKTGEKCTNTSGMMDYHQKEYKKWTACSHEDLLTFYQERTRDAGTFCLETACSKLVK